MKRVTPLPGHSEHSRPGRQPTPEQFLRPTWPQLSASARLFRVAHATWGGVNLLALARVWTAVAARQRDRAVCVSMALLCVEGVALAIGRGNCPFGPFQESLGDPVPMFEWVLPPRAAKAAIPILSVATWASFVGLWLRPPRDKGTSFGKEASSG